MYPSVLVLQISFDSRVKLTVGDVVLHPSPRINLEFLGINRSSQSTIKSPGILSFGVAFGVIDMLSRQVTSESFGSDFEFGGSVSMGYHQSHVSVAGRPRGRCLPRKPRIMTMLRIVCRFVLESPAVSTA